MLPVSKNITVYQGDTFDLVFRLRNPDTSEGPGSYIDLTGCTAKAQVRSTEIDPTVLAEFTPTVDGVNGQVSLRLSSTQTAGLAAGVWDVQLTFPDGTIKTYLKGTVTVVKEVTRA